MTEGAARPVGLRDRIVGVEGSSEGDFMLDGVRFKVALGADQRSRLTDAGGVALGKGWRFVDQELAELRNVEVRQMLEFGVQQGGSAALWSLALPLSRYVGIDRDPLDLPFPDALRDHPAFRVVTLWGGVQQEDREAVRRIIETEFVGPLDLVVDDASHQLAQSTASFEVAFPRLRQGGAYVIEDWDWAHQPGPWDDPRHPWARNPSLANLLFGLTLIVAAGTGIVSRLVIRPSFAVAFRGAAELDDSFTVAAAIGGRRPLPAPI